MNIFEILPSFKICNGFVMRLYSEPVQHVCHDNLAWTWTCQKWPSLESNYVIQSDYPYKLDIRVEISVIHVPNDPWLR